MFLVFDSSAYARLGGFDERFFLYYEDYDLCARLERRGLFAIGGFGVRGDSPMRNARVIALSGTCAGTC